MQEFAQQLETSINIFMQVFDRMSTQGTLKPVAKFLMSLKKELVEEGFSEQEAMQIILATTNSFRPKK